MKGTLAVTGLGRSSWATLAVVPMAKPTDGRRHDTFEGTEQIQQLVIARAISGLRIE